VARIAPTVTVIALLAGTGIAFAVTERLKLERSPITAVRIPDRRFSPVCDCPHAKLAIGFRLRKADHLTLQIVDRDGHVVRTIVDDEKMAPGDLNFKWDGRDDDGRRLPDGVYRPRIELARHSRQFVLPNPIRVDTVRPRFLGATVSPDVISPDRDGRREYLVARYQVTEPSKVYVEVNGKQRVESRARPTEGRLQWFGHVGKRALPAGTYTVRLVAEDRAGNRRASRLLEVKVLYIDILRKRARARAGTDFSLRVTTYARRFSWRLRKRYGTARAGALHLRAPLEPGRYRLYATANGHTDTARIRVVRP
jgi:FlgD Ig-like domain